MNTQDRQLLKRKIDDDLSRSRQQLRDLEELTQAIAPDNAIGRVSRMDAINNKSVDEALLRKVRLKIQRLEKALTKLDEPSFGTCIRCKEQIPVARLILLPESVRCVKCA